MPATLPVSYTSVPYILLTVPEVGSHSNTTSASLAHYAGKAEAEINGRINKLYQLPFGVDVPLLTTLATDLAVYYTLTRRPLVNPQSKSDPWLQKFKESRDLLDKIASGEIQLIDSNGSAIAQSTTIMDFHSTTKDYLPTMHEAEPEDWVQDPDKVQDALDDRDL